MRVQLAMGHPWVLWEKGCLRPHCNGHLNFVAHLRTLLESRTVSCEAAMEALSVDVGIPRSTEDQARDVAETPLLFEEALSG